VGSQVARLRASRRAPPLFLKSELIARERGLRKYHRNGGFCGFYLAFEKGVTEFCLDDVNVSSSAVKIGRSKMYQVTIKGGDVFSYVGNANVGHSDDNFVVGKRHRRARLKTS
jgi:hypothetical protein